MRLGTASVWISQINCYTTFCLSMLMVLKVFDKPSTALYNFLFASLKLLTNFENAYWTLLRIPFSVIGRCSPWSADPSLAAEKINLLQTASGMILQNHRRLPVSIFSFKIAALGSLKWLLRVLQRDAVYLGWPIAPSYMSPSARGGGGLRTLSQWVQEPK